MRTMHRMKIHNWLPVLLTSLAASACGVAGGAVPTPASGAVPPGPPSAINAPLGNDFQLGYGQTATIEGEGLLVMFAEVDEESRCPVDVECVEAGWVTIRLAVKAGEGDGQDVALTLRPGAPDSARTSVEGYTIELVEVEPFPVSIETTVFNEYVATLRVSEGG
jgi:hypothetical protein